VHNLEQPQERTRKKRPAFADRLTGSVERGYA
jgi:hypothetical protein